MAVIQPDELTVAPQDADADGSALPDDVAPSEPLIALGDCDPAKAAALRQELGLHALAAQVLVRRGHDTPELARAWLEPGELLAPQELPGLVEAAQVIATHVRLGGRIAVHGDYDVDGVCSTAILVRTLAQLGAEVTWHVPSRFEDGYGLSRAGIDRFARDGVDLLIAVDCGITAVDEAAHARSLGIDLVIADHHKPGAQLPDAPIVHPGLGDYEHPDLCATAVAHKLAAGVAAELGADAPWLQDDLALVALATVCDVVPLRGENRTYVTSGLAELRRTMRPGLRELMRAAAVDQLAIDAGSLGFRLGPRINAAGRMHSAEPAVELMLTSSESRAAELAAQLSAANSRRQDVEQSILFAAESQARRQRDAFALVVAGQGWHQGVLGIVAGRIAERFRRPCVALSIENGVAKGSGRNGGVYDLHGGLSACSEHLVRFGGHKAAAGLELDEAALGEFARAFRAHAASSLTPDDLRPRVRVDAVAEPAQLTLDAAESLARLGPFGAGNPEPAIAVPAVTVTHLRKMGETGRHLRLAVAGHGGRTGIVAFDWDTAVKSGDDAPLSNVVVKLRRNEWRGTVEAQARLVTHVELATTERDDQSEDAGSAVSWTQSFVDALDASPPAPGAGGFDPELVRDSRGDNPLALLAGLAQDAASTALLVNDAARWRPVIEALSAIDERMGGLRCVEYGGDITSEPLVEHFVMAEPPLAPSLARQLPAPASMAWSTGTTRVLAGHSSSPLDRGTVASAYRAIRECGGCSGGGVERHLQAALPDPVQAGRAVRVLDELGLVRLIRNGPGVESIEVVEAPRTELDRSPTFRSYSAFQEESTRWLSSLTAEG